MGENSEIAWTDHTFNPWIGCTKISPGCAHCYAAVDTFARRSRANGLELWGPMAARHVTSEANWRKPLAWDRAARAEGVRRRVFCASLADVFELRGDLHAPRARLHRLISDTPNLDWLLLTKRPEHATSLWHMAALRARDAGGPDVAHWQPNVWLGTTVEDQARADERIPHLIATPARVRFLSCEPLLEPIELRRVRAGAALSPHAPDHTIDALRGGTWDLGHGFTQHSDLPGRIDWVIVGGESGPGARPFDLAWARSLVGQCRAAGVAAFVKQLGAKPMLGVAAPVVAQSAESIARHGEYDPDPIEYSFRDRKGGNPAEWPADLRVREMPEARRGL